MNHYTLAEMVPGLSEEFTVTVTAEMMDQFKAITGDVSPIHIDADYAKDRGFPGRVVYGMLGLRLMPVLEQGFAQYRAASNDANVHLLALPETTPATIGARQHPGAAAHRAAADVLAPFLRSILG